MAAVDVLLSIVKAAADLRVLACAAATCRDLRNVLNDVKSSMPALISLLRDTTGLSAMGLLRMWCGVQPDSVNLLRYLPPALTLTDAPVESHEDALQEAFCAELLRANGTWALDPCEQAQLVDGSVTIGRAWSVLKLLSSVTPPAAEGLAVVFVTKLIHGCLRHGRRAEYLEQALLEVRRFFTSSSTHQHEHELIGPLQEKAADGQEAAACSTHGGLMETRMALQAALSNGLAVTPLVQHATRCDAALLRALLDSLEARVGVWAALENGHVHSLQQLQWVTHRDEDVWRFLLDSLEIRLGLRAAFQRGHVLCVSWLLLLASSDAVALKGLTDCPEARWGMEAVVLAHTNR